MLLRLKNQQTDNYDMTAAIPAKQAGEVLAAARLAKARLAFKGTNEKSRDVQSFERAGRGSADLKCFVRFGCKKKRQNRARTKQIEAFESLRLGGRDLDLPCDHVAEIGAVKV